ncbi:transposase [Streptomyces sp. NPDC000345]|uniref:transposase n=1 Tax=Streptomyces sp. NPDC000345 TaxID=3364537 RepID=UPI0036852ECF
MLAYTTSRGRALVDRRLYLPEQSWCGDPERSHAAGIPKEVQFATKPRLAREMLAAALDAKVGARWVTGDEAYGQAPQLRAALEARDTGYVMAVACSTRVRTNAGRTLPARTPPPDACPPSPGSVSSCGPGRCGPVPPRSEPADEIACRLWLRDSLLNFSVRRGTYAVPKN